MATLTAEQIEEVRVLWNGPTEALVETLGLSRELSGPYLRALSNAGLLVEHAPCHGSAEPGQTPVHEPGSRRRGKVSPADTLDSVLGAYLERIKKAVCDEFGYRKKRESGALETEGWALAVTVADALLTYASGLPLPVTALSVYLIKRGILDRLCGCHPGAGPGAKLVREGKKEGDVGGC